MKLLKLGSRGPSVQLLQLGLRRSGEDLAADGIFGPLTRQALIRFQQRLGLQPDGIAGPSVQWALFPWYAGYRIHSIQPGDTVYRLSLSYGSSIEAILTANPGLIPEQLPIGLPMVIPLGFPVVPTDIACCSRLLSYCVRGLCTRYPFLRCGEIGHSVMGRPLWSLQLGQGEQRVLYNAVHHGNEWLNALVLLKFTEELCLAASRGGEVAGFPAEELLAKAQLCMIPALNPDGMDLVTGELTDGPFYQSARVLAASYPQFAFPGEWSANIRGVDLNLQYPARWETARDIRYGQGFRSPGPAYYVGPAPLSAPESRALYQFTLQYDPERVLAYHSQGEVIYWRFLDREAPGARELGEELARLSGYFLADEPYASSFAGYKDWFIQDFDRPGYTIETGLGKNPLPISQFSTIYGQNVGILAAAADFSL